MEDSLTMISIPAISAIVFWVMNLITQALDSNEKFKRFIPLLSAGLGVILGIVAFYSMPSIMPAANVLVAAVIGGASGLTATGTHQICKQLSKPPVADDSNKVEKK